MTSRLRSRCCPYQNVAQEYVPKYTPACCPPQTNTDPRRHNAYCPPTRSFSEPLSHAEYLRRLKENNGTAISSTNALVQYGEGEYKKTLWMEGVVGVACCPTGPTAPAAQKTMDAGLYTESKGAAATAVKGINDEKGGPESLHTIQKKGQAIFTEKCPGVSCEETLPEPPVPPTPPVTYSYMAVQRGQNITDTFKLIFYTNDINAWDTIVDTEFDGTYTNFFVGNVSDVYQTAFRKEGINYYIFLDKNGTILQQFQLPQVAFGYTTLGNSQINTLIAVYTYAVSATVVGIIRYNTLTNELVEQQLQIASYQNFFANAFYNSIFIRYQSSISVFEFKYIIWFNNQSTLPEPVLTTTGFNIGFNTGSSFTLVPATSPSNFDPSPNKKFLVWNQNEDYKEITAPVFASWSRFLNSPGFFSPVTGRSIQISIISDFREYIIIDYDNFSISPILVNPTRRSFSNYLGLIFATNTYNSGRISLPSNNIVLNERITNESYVQQITTLTPTNTSLFSQTISSGNIVDISGAVVGGRSFAVSGIAYNTFYQEPGPSPAFGYIMGNTDNPVVTMLYMTNGSSWIQARGSINGLRASPMTITNSTGEYSLNKIITVESLVPILEPNDGAIDLPATGTNSNQVCWQTLHQTLTRKWFNSAKLSFFVEDAYGILIQPQNSSQIVRQVEFTAGEDFTQRDPLTFTLEGSNDGGDSYTVIVSSLLTNIPNSNPSRCAKYRSAIFENSTAYTRYRITFPTTRLGNDIQLQKLQFLAETPAGFIIDGSPNPTLTLERGVTYHFKVNTPDDIFWIQTSTGAYNPANVYTTGITNNGCKSSILTFTVPVDAPSTLYYVSQANVTSLIQTFGSAFTTGAGPVDITIELIAGQTYRLFWNSGGGFANEVGVEILTPGGTSLYNMPFNSQTLRDTTLFIFDAAVSGNYIFRMRDSFADGWNGNTMSVFLVTPSQKRGTINIVSSGAPAGNITGNWWAHVNSNGVNRTFAEIWFSIQNTAQWGSTALTVIQDTRPSTATAGSAYRWLMGVSGQNYLFGKMFAVFSSTGTISSSDITTKIQQYVLNLDLSNTFSSTRLAHMYRHITPTVMYTLPSYASAVLTDMNYGSSYSINNCITFEVLAYNAITIKEFTSIFSGTGSQLFNIWVRVGGVQHSAGNPPVISTANGWSVLANFTLALSLSSTLKTGEFPQRYIPYEGNYSIPAGIKVGFAIFASGSLRTQNRTFTSANFFENNDFRVSTGPDVGYSNNITNPPPNINTGGSITGFTNTEGSFAGIVSAVRDSIFTGRNQSGVTTTSFTPTLHAGSSYSLLGTENSGRTTEFFGPNFFVGNAAGLIHYENKSYIGRLETDVYNINLRIIRHETDGDLVIPLVPNTIMIRSSPFTSASCFGMQKYIYVNIAFEGIRRNFYFVRITDGTIVAQGIDPTNTVNFVNCDTKLIMRNGNSTVTMFRDGIFETSTERFTSIVSMRFDSATTNNTLFAYSTSRALALTDSGYTVVNFPTPLTTVNSIIAGNNHLTLIQTSPLRIYVVDSQANLYTYSQPENTTLIRRLNTTTTMMTHVTYTSTQVNYLFRLTDSVGNGWNNAVMELKQISIIIGTLRGPPNFCPDCGPNFEPFTPLDITFSLTAGQIYKLVWNTGGQFASEVAVQVLTPGGETVLYTMPFNSQSLVGQTLYTFTATVTGNYIFRMNDSYGDGWNDATMQVINETPTTIQTFGPTFTSGFGPVDFTVSLIVGATYSLVWTVAGTAPTEVGIQIFNGFASSIYQRSVGTGVPSSYPSTLTTFTAQSNSLKNLYITFDTITRQFYTNSPTTDTVTNVLSNFLYQPV